MDLSPTYLKIQGRRLSALRIGAIAFMKMNENQRENLGFPYKVNDLLPLGKFVKFCEYHGIHVTREELESLDRESILIPVGRIILRGEKRKSRSYRDSKKSPAKREAVVKLAYWLERPWEANNGLGSAFKKRIEIAAKKDYKTWSAEPRYDIVATKSGNIRRSEEIIYSKKQMYVLAAVKMMRGATSSAPSVAELQGAILGYVDFFKVFNKIEELWFEWAEKANQYLDKEKTENPKISKKRLQGLLIQHQRIISKKYVKCAHKILKKHKFRPRKIDAYMFELMKAGRFSGAFDYRAQCYICRLSESDLIEIDDPYRTAHILVWFLSLLDGSVFREEPVKGLLLRPGAFCLNCGCQFERIRITQQYCPKKECQGIRQRETAKEWRRREKPKRQNGVTGSSTASAVHT